MQVKVSHKMSPVQRRTELKSILVVTVPIKISTNGIILTSRFNIFHRPVLEVSRL